MVLAFNPSTWEAGAGRSLNSRPAWSTKSSRSARATQRNPSWKRERRGEFHKVTNKKRFGRLERQLMLALKTMNKKKCKAALVV